MDRRIRDRRRSINRQRGRRRAGIVFPIVVLLCAGGLFLWLRSTDVFAVKQIAATATERVTQEDIARITSSVQGESLLKLSTGALEEALLELPYVRSAEVHRCFPNALEIDLSEYDPVARVQAEDGEVWLVSESGRLLEQAGGVTSDDLPLVVPAASFAAGAGEQVPDAIADALPLAGLLESAQMSGRLPAAERITVSTAGYVAMQMAGGTELRLGAPIELEQKLTVAAGVIAQCLKDEKIIEYLDVTVLDRVAVKAK